MNLRRWLMDCIARLFDNPLESSSDIWDALGRGDCRFYQPDEDCDLRVRAALGGWVTVILPKDTPR